MSVVAFVYADWITRYPEFATSATFTGPSQAQVTDCFTQATLYLDNTDSSIVQDIPTRTMLLYMLTAHITQIRFGSSIAAVSPLVGRIDSAAEGSVNVSVKAPEGFATAGWLMQTPYGYEYWAATARYRAARYVPAPRRRFR